MIPTRTNQLSMEVVARAVQPLFVQCISQEFAAQGLLRDTDLYRAGSEGSSWRAVSEVLTVTTERLAHETAARVMLYVSVILPVSAFQEVSVTWPKGWWQAFRLRCFPRWWLRRHPVKYRRESLRASIDMADVLRTCMETPSNGCPTDTVMVRPSVEFDRR